jgi:phenylacetate-CoA ligase
MSGLPDYVVLDRALERLSTDALRELQGDRLRAMVAYAYDRAPFWRVRLDAAGVHPHDIRGLDDLPRLPLCTRQDIERDQAVHPPFGSYLACEPARLAKFMTTSGTTGRPLTRVFSARDWRYVLDRFQRNPRVGVGDVVVVLGPIDGLMGPTASAESSARAGALVVLAGLHDTRTKLRLLEQLRPRTVSGTASYLLHLASIAQASGLDLRSLRIAVIVSVGEPGAAIPSTRQRLADAWGAAVSDGYGLTELFPLGSGCRESTSLHIASDFVITEIVDPETGTPVPHGEPGEVVYTNIIGDTQPLLRYRTRDVARMATDGTCACGFTGVRLRNSIEGRIDDMIWYRGVNVFPSAVEGVVRGIAELGDEYEIVVDRERELPEMTLRVEVRSPLVDATSPLEHRLRRELTAALRVTPHIELLPVGALPRADGDAKRRRVVEARGARQ